MEQGLHVGLTEEVPADDGGEGEEQHADGHEGVAEGAEGLGEGRLGQGRAGETALLHGLQQAGGQDHQRRHGQHHEGVDEHAHHGDDALILWLFHLCQGVGVGRGAHAGLIGEQAPGHAEAHGLLDAQTQCAAEDGLGIEGAHEDGLDGGEKVGVVDDQDDEASQDVEAGHDGHDLLREGGDAPHAADEDERGDGGHNDAHDGLGDAESGVEGVSDGVGLDHVAHEAQGQDDGDGEEAGQELAEAALEGRLDIVDGTAGDMAVLVCGLELLCQHGLAVDGGHAEEGGDPHPEDGAGAAGVQGGGAAGDVAGAHLGGDGGGQSLEGAHALLAGLFAAEGEAAEQAAPALAELADLDKPGTDRVIDTGEQQQEQQQQLLVPQDVVDCANDLGDDGFHSVDFPSVPGKRDKKKKSGTVTRSHSTNRSGKSSPQNARKDPSGLYSVLLPERFSAAGRRALHLRYSSLSFSRATSILSPHPDLRAPESFTPSAGFRHFPKNFVCRY